MKILANRDAFTSSMAISNEIRNVVSARTIHRRLLDANLLKRRARRIPLLRRVYLEARKHFFASAHKKIDADQKANKIGTNTPCSDEKKKICLEMEREETYFGQKQDNSTIGGSRGLMHLRKHFGKMCI